MLQNQPAKLKLISHPMALLQSAISSGPLYFKSCGFTAREWNKRKCGTEWANVVNSGENQAELGYLAANSGMGKLLV